MPFPRSFFYLTLVRHGQTESNRLRVIQGQMDTQLSHTGREQAMKLSSYLSSLGVSFDIVFSSDLSRALETAKIIVNNICPKGELVINQVATSKHSMSESTGDPESNDGIDRSVPERGTEGHPASSHPRPGSLIGPSCSSVDIQVDQSLRERSLGVLEGKTWRNPCDAAQAAGLKEKNYTSLVPAGGESLEQIQQRVSNFCCNQLIDQVIAHRNLQVTNAADSRLTDSGSSDSATSNLTSSINDEEHVERQMVSCDDADSSLDRPVSVLVITHGGIILEFMRHFRDHCKCLLSPLHEPLQVSPNTGVTIFKVHYEHRAKLQRYVIPKAELLVYHYTIHLDEQADQVSCVPAHPSNLSYIIKQFEETRAEKSTRAKSHIGIAKPRYEAL